MNDFSYLKVLNEEKVVGQCIDKSVVEVTQQDAIVAHTRHTIATRTTEFGLRLLLSHNNLQTQYKTDLILTLGRYETGGLSSGRQESIVERVLVKKV